MLYETTLNLRHPNSEEVVDFKFSPATFSAYVNAVLSFFAPTLPNAGT